MTENNNEYKYSLIVTIVNRGFADSVIAAAKDAGARGGTVLYARGSGIHETETFLHIPIQPEKELVLTLVLKGDVKDIVTAITEKAGLNEEGRGISFVLPVMRTAGIVSAMAKYKELEEKQREIMASEQPETKEGDN